MSLNRKFNHIGFVVAHVRSQSAKPLSKIFYGDGICALDFDDFFRSLFCCLVGCSSNHRAITTTSTEDDSSILIPNSLSLSVKQNDSESLDLNPDVTIYPTATVTIVPSPTYGDVSISGTSIEYTTINATFSGTDQFTYRIINDGVTSDLGTFEVTITPLSSDLLRLLKTIREEPLA